MNAQTVSESQAADPVSIVILSQCVSDGVPFWAFAAIPAEKYLALKTIESSGEPFDLRDYGEIIAWGHGENPPEETTTAMKEKFGYEPDFDEKLANELMKLEYERQKIEYLKKLEEQNNAQNNADNVDNVDADSSGSAPEDASAFIRDILSKKKPSDE